MSRLVAPQMAPYFPAGGVTALDMFPLWVGHYSKHSVSVNKKMAYYISPIAMFLQNIITIQVYDFTSTLEIQYKVIQVLYTLSFIMFYYSPNLKEDRQAL